MSFRAYSWEDLIRLSTVVPPSYLWYVFQRTIDYDI